MASRHGLCSRASRTAAHPPLPPCCRQQDGQVSVAGSVRSALHIPHSMCLIAGLVTAAGQQTEQGPELSSSGWQCTCRSCQGRGSQEAPTDHRSRTAWAVQQQ